MCVAYLVNAGADLVNAGADLVNTGADLLNVWWVFTCVFTKLCRDFNKRECLFSRKRCSFTI